MVKNILERLLHKGIVINPIKKHKSFCNLTGNVDKKSRTFVAIRRKFRKKGRPGGKYVLGLLPVPEPLLSISTCC